jgi:hypothetical protein
MARLGWVGFGNGLPERGFAEFGKCLNFLAGQISERAFVGLDHESGCGAGIKPCAFQ